MTRIDEMASEASNGGAKIVVFPELITTGYLSPEAIAPLAESIPGPTTSRLAEIARSHDISMDVGIAEKTDSARYNTMLLIGPDGGELLRYHKVHLWDTERKWADPGDRFDVVESDGVKLGMWICYDTRFPEAARSLAISGAELALVGSAWLGPSDEWELAICSRAMDNGIFVAASALQGQEYRGGSLIVDPHGVVIARGNEGEETVVFADVDLAVASEFRERVPLLSHLRHDAYSA